MVEPQGAKVAKERGEVEDEEEDEEVIGQWSLVIRKENEDAASSLESDILILVSLTGMAMRPRSADTFRKDSPPEAAEEMFKCE